MSPEALAALGMTPESAQDALRRSWKRSLDRQGLPDDWKPPAAVINRVAALARAGKGGDANARAS